MSEHRNDDRFKWIISAIVILVSLAMILGTIMELAK